ncbi:MAG TPA: DNA mismatch repair endonuclease MutL [Pyrinomonadaceae bacterium]|jgi:DNA mismatch repair protein MutL|nr:DNA mismatch repair endonuclease MutL [Pyrinomonadaceae bacterium]
MSKIRVLPDHISNLIAAGEVVERPASVAKELVENAIDAGASRIVIDVESGGRRLLKIIDDGEGMTRDDAILAFERHATSKIRSADDLSAIGTLGFRGEALASIASVARVELVTRTDDSSAGTRVIIEGGRMRDVKDAAHPRGTTIGVRDLFFNTPARRKFLRSEATESYHLTNLVTHYALAHPEINFTLTNNGRESLRVAPAKDLRERAYQVFGAQFLDGLLEVNNAVSEPTETSFALPQIARVRGFISAPRERRTSRDAQFLFVNGRFVRDRLIGRALSEGYRAILPHGVYPVALLFIDVPLAEVDVNVHPAKTEVRFRRAAAVADAVREAVRSALASADYAPATDTAEYRREAIGADPDDAQITPADVAESEIAVSAAPPGPSLTLRPAPHQERIGFGFAEAVEKDAAMKLSEAGVSGPGAVATGSSDTSVNFKIGNDDRQRITAKQPPDPVAIAPGSDTLPPLDSALKFVREVAVESVSSNIRPLGQLDESFIIATDDEGLLLIDQHVAHERVLFDKYRALESSRKPESQQMLIPETFDLTPAQASAFDAVAEELETYGFELMRLSGRTVAIKSTPADLPASEARNVLSEVLETVDAEKRGAARATLRDEIAASLACHAAIKVNMPLAPEKMRWLIDRLLTTSSPTTCPHGRPVILRLATQDILKGFHRI